MHDNGQAGERATTNSSNRLFLCGLVSGLTGLAIGAALFTKEKIVEKPIDVVRTVEKPVEVVRIVEKTVTKPAELSQDQLNKLAIAEKLLDLKNQKNELGPFKLSERVFIYSSIGNSIDEIKDHVSADAIIAKVESAFRKQGFKVLTFEATKDPASVPYSIVQVSGDFITVKPNNNGIESVSFTAGVTMFQPASYFVHPSFFGSKDKLVGKNGYLPLLERKSLFFCGKNRFNEIPKTFEDGAELLANDFRKVMDN